jgi:hypothetical protein
MNRKNKTPEDTSIRVLNFIISVMLRITIMILIFLGALLSIRVYNNL